MIRQHLGERGVGADPLFRWRGGEVSRLEAFSDAVFAFSLTLLVVSLEVPRSIDALFLELTNFLAFGVAFLLLYYLWYEHYLYFRRYGLSDHAVVVVNGVLLFLAVFFVYPTKFLLIYVINGVFLSHTFGLAVAIPIEMRGVDGVTYPILFTIYAGGFTLIYLCYRKLYLLAFARAARLDLDETERRLTFQNIVRFSYLATIPLVAVVLVWVLPIDYGGHVSGFSLGLLWFADRFAEQVCRRVYDRRHNANVTAAGLDVDPSQPR